MITIRLARGVWQFEPTQPLGPAGGFGEVFAGTGPDGAPVAVKRLKVTADEAAHRELQMADRLMTRTLAHVVPILDAGQDAESDRYYVVMARAERSLQDEINARGPLPLADTISVLVQIGDGLLEAADVVHRDLKPANVLWHDGRWKIADFGIARFVEDSTSANTVRDALSPQYAAPEQWIGEHATPSTDVYALGCIAYKLLTGTPPFAGPAVADFRNQHLTTAPPRLALEDGRFVSLVASMLRKPAPARPTIVRVAAVLRDVRDKPPTDRRGVIALKQAGAVEATRRAEMDATQAAKRERSQRRQAIADDAIAIFAELKDQLAAAAREADPTVVVTADARNVEVRLGTAALGMRLAQTQPLAADSLAYAKWDPVIAGIIEVRQADPPWSHGATLWYVRLPNQNEYRWFEVSYKDNAFSSETLRGPYAVGSLRDADMAVGGGMHTVEIASGPTPIDGEDADVFVDRWLDRLAQAYHGRLRPF